MGQSVFHAGGTHHGRTRRSGVLLEEEGESHLGKVRRRAHSRAKSDLEVLSGNAVGVVGRRAERDGKVTERDVEHVLQVSVDEQ